MTKEVIDKSNIMYQFGYEDGKNENHSFEKAKKEAIINHELGREQERNRIRALIEEELDNALKMGFKNYNIDDLKKFLSEIEGEEK